MVQVVFSIIGIRTALSLTLFSWQGKVLSTLIANLTGFTEAEFILHQAAALLSHMFLR